MGKLIKFITILIFIDLFFISTGQVCSQGSCSLGSNIFNVILNLGNASATELWKELISSTADLTNSTTGILALLGTGAVIVGAFFATKSELLLFIPITATLALVTNDLIFIFSYLNGLNSILATFIMAPLIIIYVLTVVEWLRGKD